ncbi:carbohydrate kinase [Marinomonas mediterranea]|jgi:Sugar kinases, ribokinase family|uniref:Fructokinase n=1 Tax=Marinomonas mediterranea (strain ATCC 700492 / JCM 21426 / NBRC 103028 / MMB-1) TaxID=717774 RepID=F2K035_MARM1|nr:carbohydrate kinase [Marinomonas mediterranea]ADZ93249.1 Fructokinase [Marinomonas mediterranea MMB-1]WCN15200.1 carbohydrate kinase [Marinomonas mediterranea]WCN19244.1 carbohydrate kinase [Marinomonas mediterranea MMB-1]
MTTKILSFGEALIDFLSNGAIKKGELETFTKFPGGAPANVAVAAALLGGDSHFVGQVGDDAFGHFLKDELEGYGVKTDSMLMTSDAKTALAFVSLDETGERSFEFYRNPSADMLFKSEDFSSAWFESAKGVFHTCSNTLTDENITAATMTGIELAKAANWVVSIDVNLRTNLWPNNTVDTARVITWMQTADVVKASLEELSVLASDPYALIQESLEKGVAVFVLTDGGNPVRYYTSTDKGEVQTPKVDVKDTTAAGDAFVGGLLYQLAEQGGDRASVQSLSQAQLHNIVRFAVACGADSVTRLGAYPSLPNLEQVEARLTQT